jgi:hypothetical protein
MQALRQSGHESAYDNCAVTYVSASTAHTTLTPFTATRSTDALLMDCLQQTYAIKHLSLHEDEQKEVARLHALVELAGAQGLSVGAEEQCLQRLAILAREAMLSADGIGS